MRERIGISSGWEVPFTDRVKEKNKPLSLLDELKRRKVIRVAIGYVVVAWVTLQVADVILNNLGAPAWVFRVLLLFLAIGLPVAVFFSWAVEITPDGLRREQELEGARSRVTAGGRRLLFGIFSVISVAAFYFAAGRIIEADRERLPPMVDVPKMSIAVLPFANRSAQAEDVFFVDGIHDDVLTRLANLSVFERVISRTSVDRYRGTDLRIPEIGRELGVAHILEGGVQRAGDRVRINVQLIEAETDEHLWAENYERQLTVENLFAVQADITRAIVAELESALSDEEDARLGAAPTDSFEAYGEYVLGRHLLARRETASTVSARRHFENAIGLDRDFALPYVGLALAINVHSYLTNQDVEESLEARQSAVDTALSIDPTLGEAWSALADVRLDQRRLEQAETLYRKAIELSPNYAHAHQQYATLLTRLERFDEAVSNMRRAVELDPHEAIYRANLGFTLLRAGEPGEAHREVMDGLQRQPDFGIYYRFMIRYADLQNRPGEALAWAEAGLKQAPNELGLRESRCRFLLALAYYQQAERCYFAIEQDGQGRPHVERIQAYRYMGATDKAIELAEELANEGFPFQVMLGWAYLDSGNVDAAYAVAEKLMPDLFAAGGLPDGQLPLFPTAMAAKTLSMSGQADRADALHEMMLAQSAGISLANLGGMVAALQAESGDTDLAASTLREAVDTGWHFGWQELRLPFFDYMRDVPEWESALNEIEAEVEAQRRWYEENKDKPLF